MAPAATPAVTPATVSRLAVGDEYQIRVELENYRAFYKTVAVTTQDPVLLEHAMQPLARGVIEVDSSPQGARIILNGQDTGLVTPNKVENLEIQKSHALKLQAPNYYEWSGPVDIKDFTPVKLQATLMPVAAPQQPITVPTQPVVPTPPQTPVTPQQALLTPQQTPQVTQPVQPVQTPPATPPAQKTEFGKLRVTSDPAGSRILLNGQGTGKVTPATLEGLESGKRVTVSVMRDGFKDWSRSVTIEGNKTSSLSAALKAVEKTPVQPPIETPPTTPEPSTASIPKQPEPTSTIESGKPASLSVSSEPSGAEVYINSELKGTTPLKVTGLSPGNVRVIVSKEGAMKYSTTVHLGSGESKSLGTIKLGDPYGEISVRSTPPRATVIFDGESIGARTPVTIRRVPRDRAHSLKVELDGYRSWSSSVSLKDSDSKKYDVMLEKD